MITSTPDTECTISQTKYFLLINILSYKLVSLLLYTTLLYFKLQSNSDLIRSTLQPKPGVTDTSEPHSTRVKDSESNTRHFTPTRHGWNMSIPS